MEEEKEYRVVIPDEVHTLIKYQKNGVPSIATINSALVDFEPKIVFSWLLTLSTPIKEKGDNEMPTPDEQEALYEFEDHLDPVVKANGNALFLARTTACGYRELMYRIYDPEPLNDQLQNIINTKNYVRGFEYRIEQDKSWELSGWFLNAVKP